MSASNSGYLSPDEITNKSFDTKRRGGLDPEAVKRHLASAAATVHGLLAERSALTDQVARLQEQLAEAEANPVPQAELDEDALTERLGKDAARVLAEARAAAADRIAEAEAQADDIRAAAEEIYAERSMLADEEANRIRQSAEQLRSQTAEEAEQSAAQIIARAESDAEALRAGVAGERQSADADASRIVREAELTRRQILEDLARRRSAARRQIEQLRAGRERLLASHEMVRRALDEISEELTISMSEARAAAETAGHSVSDTTIEELEAEIETARLTGLLDTGPVPIVSRPKVTPVPAAVEPPAEQSVVDEAGTEEVATEEVVTEKVVEDVDVEEEAATESVEQPAPESADTVSTDEPDTSAGDGMSNVVQLDLARNDVDTATHPATGRDASSGRGGNSTSSPPEQKAPVLEAVESLKSVKSVETPPVDDSGGDAVADDPTLDPLDEEDSVGDLFATLRSTPAPAPKKAKPAAKKVAAKKSTAKKARSKPTSKSTSKSKAASEPEIEVDSSDVARRLKRVLADEQSRAMSRVKGSDAMPSLEALLGEPTEHVEGYWVEIVAQIDDVESTDDQLRKPVDELVDTIRRRVGDALADAGDDSEGAVSSLRSVYREVKTQRIGVCADQVCRMAMGRSADRA